MVTQYHEAERFVDFSDLYNVRLVLNAFLPAHWTLVMKHSGEYHEIEE